MATTSWNKIFGGAMLVSGTCIGAGMLGLPVSTAAAGFTTSSAAFIFCWFMMLLSAFLMLEVSLWYPEETNLITMAKSTLGKPGEIVAWFTYVLFLYAIMTAYTAGATAIISTFLAKLGISQDYGIWIVVFIFATVVYFGAQCVDWVNRLLMTGLIIAYIILIVRVLPQVSTQLLTGGESKYIWTVGPLLVTSFGFHLLIPTLKNYLHQDIPSLRWSIFLGSLIPLVIYLLWEVIVLGIIPITGENSLLAIAHAEKHFGKQVVVELTQLLTQILNTPQITLFANIFGLCALLTSFVGVALGLFDFFADGFNIHKNTMGKIMLSFLTFLPPILFAIFYPRFMLALRYAGIFAAILLVIMPALMAWSGRYRLRNTSAYQLWGGKPVIILVLLFGLGIIGLEILERLQLLPVASHVETLIE